MPAWVLLATLRGRHTVRRAWPQSKLFHDEHVIRPFGTALARQWQGSSEYAPVHPELRIAPADSSADTRATYRERFGASALESQSRAELGFAAWVHGHGDGPKLRLVHETIGRAVVGLVKRVEPFRADLHVQRLQQAELA